jgi:hypothetical protein
MSRFFDFLGALGIFAVKRSFIPKPTGPDRATVMARFELPPDSKKVAHHRQHAPCAAGAEAGRPSVLCRAVSETHAEQAGTRGAGPGDGRLSDHGYTEAGNTPSLPARTLTRSARKESADQSPEHSTHPWTGLFRAWFIRLCRPSRLS